MSGYAERIEHTSGSIPTVQSFESFYQSEFRSVLAVAYVLTGHRSEAEDLTQEAFAAAFRTWSSLANPPAWVRAVVSNGAMSWWRHVYAGRRAIDRLGAPEPVDEIPEDTAGFWAEVRRLPRRQAQTITLYYLEDMSTAQIAEVLGCDVSTVRIHLSRGRKALAKVLEVTE